MDHSEMSVGQFVAASVAVVAIFTVFAAAVACIGQASHMLWLTEDLSWLAFATG